MREVKKKEGMKDIKSKIESILKSYALVPVPTRIRKLEGNYYRIYFHPFDKLLFWRIVLALEEAGFETHPDMFASLSQIDVIVHPENEKSLPNIDGKFGDWLRKVKPKVATKTLSRVCTLCGELIVEGQKYIHYPSTDVYKHLSCIEKKLGELEEENK
ncbi:MAG: hypothetical protein ACTSPV_05185 [Candidatus Hodarchaeales archaeon]